jgi:hypothetical protein
MKTPRKNANPEHKLQVQVRDYLMTALPPSIEWTANAAGVHVSIHTANKMKAACVLAGPAKALASHDHRTAALREGRSFRET